MILKKKMSLVFFAIIMVLCFSSLRLLSFAVKAEEVILPVTGESLPNEIPYNDYATEFGEQGIKGWTYRYKNPGGEWTKFAAADYNSETLTYTAPTTGATITNLSVTPTGGASLSRDYTAPKSMIVRFAVVLNAWNSSGDDVSAEANFDGQQFYILKNGQRQPLNFVEIGVADTPEKLEEIVESTNKTLTDYQSGTSVEMPNTKKGVYLAFADVKMSKDEVASLIIDPDGNDDGFAGVWCDGANFRAKAIVSYYKAENGRELSNGDVLDESTIPGDFGPMGYFINPTWDGSTEGMPSPNTYLQQFSAAEGMGGWYYKFIDPDLGMQNMVYKESLSKFVAPADNPGAGDDLLYISQNAIVANFARPVIKAFKADKTGIIRFVGQVRNGYHEAQPYSEGAIDGMKFYVKNSNNEKIAFKYGISLQDIDDTKIEDPESVTYQQAENNEIHLRPDDQGSIKYNSVYNIICETKVEKGDFIYFYADAVSQPWCDKMYLGIVPIYTYLDPADMITAEDFTPTNVFEDLYALSFTNKQGGNNWYYSFGNAKTDFYNMVLDGSQWKTGFGSTISATAIAPAVGYDAIKSFRAPTTGKVRILGLANKAEVGGDGVSLNISKRSGTTFNDLAAINIEADDTNQKEIMLGNPREEATYISVNAGDVISFSAKAGATAEKDALNLKIYVVYTSSENDSSTAILGDKIPPYTFDTVLKSQLNLANGSAQGNGNWYKFFGNAVEYYKMKHDGIKWTTGYEGKITDDNMLPSKKFDTIKAYRAESTGKLSILGIVNKLTAGGNGVDFVITHKTGAQNIEKVKLSISSEDLAKKDITLELDVNAGDWIFFSASGKKKIDNDEINFQVFAYYKTITESPVLSDDLGDSTPPVKTVDEYIIDDFTAADYSKYMTDNYGEQGKNGWYYLYGLGDDYYLMRKDGNNFKGPSSDPYNIVEGPQGTAPGNVWNTIRAYQVPNDGYMRIFAHFNFWQGGGGDGVKMTIKNQTTGEVIYNEIYKGGNEWEAIHTVATNEFKVKRGDVIFFSLNKNGDNNECDNVTMGLLPIYSIKTSNETDLPTGGIGAKEYNEDSIPPEVGTNSENTVHTITIPAVKAPETGCGLSINGNNYIWISISAVIVLGALISVRFVKKTKKLK